MDKLSSYPDNCKHVTKEISNYMYDVRLYLFDRYNTHGFVDFDMQIG